MKSDFLIALTQLVAERHLPREQVVEAIEAALVSAFKRDSANIGQDLSVTLDPGTGEMTVHAVKTVVEEVEDPQREITLKEALKLKKDVALGEEVTTLEALPHQASRIAAQTAKQVVLQRLREAEREKTFQEFQGRIEDVVSGVVDQFEAGRVIILELGRVEAILPPEEQVPTERYRKGQRLKVYILDVRRTARGPEIIVSRTHKNLLRRLFEVEVPEVFNGVVEIKAIAREAGFRSKVAVASRQDGVDPVGSCIGMRGNRIQSIVNELQGEKIDIVRWDKDVKTFISNGLGPSEVVHVEINSKEQTAVVAGPERQLSLAIGKEGQNARLAAKLTGWHLDIKSLTEWDAIKSERRAEVVVPADEIASDVVADVLPMAVPQDEPVAEAKASDMEVLVEEVPAGEDIPVVATVQPAIPATSEPALTPEEEVLSQVLEEEEEPEEEGAEEGEEVGVAFDDSIWQSTVVTPDAGKIRFAEDLSEEFGGTRGRRGRRGRGNNNARGRKAGTQSASGGAAPRSP